MKYFYTDPLKAAWMMLQHKVSLFADVNDNALFMAFNRNGITVNGNIKRFEIEQICNDIFHPQIGDLVEFRDKHTAYVYAKDLKSIPAAKPQHSDPCFTVRDSEIIIQRNGKAFFMPEVEA